MESHILTPSDFPIRSIVKQLMLPETPAEFMPVFWRAASEAYQELHACLPPDTIQDELNIGYRKTSSTTFTVRVSMNSMS